TDAWLKGRRSLLDVCRIPAYTFGMDAKERYRQRLKLQAALARVIEVLGRNGTEGIPADRMTGELAAQVVIWLVRFVTQAGVKLPDPSKEGPDLSRYVKVLKARKKETRARYGRRIRKYRRETEQQG